MEKFNALLVSCPRNMEDQAAREVSDVLYENLDYKDSWVTPIYDLNGLLVAEFKANPEKVIKKIIDLLEHEEEKNFFYYTLKFVPIMYKMETNLEEIQTTVSQFAEKIHEGDRWRILLRRRKCDIPREDIIEAAAKEINSGKVDLESPEYYIRIEITGNTTYISFSRIKELSLVKYKRKKDQLEDLIITEEHV
ncbi:MAG: THUMP domain-containing protein [Promethearchaeia archaeon]